MKDKPLSFNSKYCTILLNSVTPASIILVTGHNRSSMSTVPDFYLKDADTRGSSTKQPPAAIRL